MLTTPFGRIKIIADGHEIAYEAISYNSTVKSIKLQPLTGSYRITVPAWAYREVRCVVDWNCTPIENTGASGERYRDAEFFRGSDILTIDPNFFPRLYIHSADSQRSICPTPIQYLQVLTRKVDGIFKTNADRRGVP